MFMLDSCLDQDNLGKKISNMRSMQQSSSFSNGCFLVLHKTVIKNDPYCSTYQ